MDPLFANDFPGTYPPSYWWASAQPPSPRAALEGDARVDAAIVGAGYAGLSAALALAERGADVVVLDAHRAGFGASGRNGGQVATMPRVDMATLEARLGADGARAHWDLAREARARVETLIERHAIDCDWRLGHLHADWRAEEVAATHETVERLREIYGYDALEPLDRDGVRARLDTRAFQGGWFDRRAAHLHPLKYALGLAAAAEAAGARILEKSCVTAIEPGKRVRLRTRAGSLSADFALLAGNGYLSGLAPELDRRVMPINNFLVATGPLAASPIRGEFSVSDSRHVVRYFKPSADGRLIFGGGETYRYRFPDDIRPVVRPQLIEIFPQLADAPLPHAWGGTLAITRTRTPYFARLAPNVLTTAGFSGQGVAMATLAGAIAADAIVGAAERFDRIAAVPPPPFPGGPAFRAPLLALAMSWYALRDRL